MSEKRFICGLGFPINSDDPIRIISDSVEDKDYYKFSDICNVLNEQQELIEELQVSDEMGWKRAEHFEKKCPKELHNKKMYIKRLEYKVQKFKEENEQLRNELDKYKIVILQFVGLLVENGIIDSSVKEEVDELLEELSGDGV